MTFCMIQQFKVIIYSKRGVNYKLERARGRIHVPLGQTFLSTPLAAAAFRWQLSVSDSSFAWENR